MTGTTTACSDQAQSEGGFFSLPVSGSRVTIAFNGANAPLLGTRSAGPLDADVAAALPARTVAPSRILHGRDTIDLTGVGRFASHGLAWSPPPRSDAPSATCWPRSESGNAATRRASAWPGRPRVRTRRGASVRRHCRHRRSDAAERRLPRSDRPSPAVLELSKRANRLEVTLSPSSSQADPLRTRCPGPELGSQHQLTSASLPLSVLRHPSFTVKLGGGSSSNDPYQVTTRSTLTITLRRTKVRTRILSYAARSR